MQRDVMRDEMSCTQRPGLAHAGGGDLLDCLPIGRGRWQVLFGGAQRPLLVPSGNVALQRRCVSYFLPSGPRALYAGALLAANRALPELELLPEWSAGAGARDFLSQHRPPGEPSRTAIQIGTPGPFQKASVLLVSAHGAPLLYAKIAMADRADRQIALEAGWLRELESMPGLAGRVPRLLAESRATSGRRYIATTLAPGSGSTRSFTSGHEAFLSTLARAGAMESDFRVSPYHRVLASDLSRLAPHAAAADLGLLNAALRDCELALAGWTGPYVLSHGDFVPWNIRSDGDGIFVFDWEYARAGANPLADACNYFVMQRAVSGRALDARFMARALARVAALAAQLHPRRDWPARVVSGLGLGYLLGVLLHYSTASESLDRRHPVTAGYLRLIKERAAWMAA